MKSQFPIVFLIFEAVVAVINTIVLIMACFYYDTLPINLMLQLFTSPFLSLGYLILIFLPHSGSFSFWRKLHFAICIADLAVYDGLTRLGFSSITDMLCWIVILILPQLLFYLHIALDIAEYVLPRREQ